jgi:hypothetical protein
MKNPDPDPRNNPTTLGPEDVSLLLEKYKEAHPAMNAAKIEALEKALARVHIESEFVKKDHLTTIATALSGSIGLSLLTAAFTPEVPILVLGAATVGLIGSWLLSRKLEVSIQNTDVAGSAKEKKKL